MNVIQKLADQKSQVDRMWERLLELVLFLRTKKHRKPVEILKSFISKPDHPSPRLAGAEEKELRRIFIFLGEVYKTTPLAATRLATDQTHFYTMVSAIIGGGLLERIGAGPLTNKLARFSNILEGNEILPEEHAASEHIKKYRDISTKQTTDVSRRDERQKQFIAAIDAL
jgi:hypothetical protein